MVGKGWREKSDECWQCGSKKIRSHDFDTLSYPLKDGYLHGNMTRCSDCGAVWNDITKFAIDEIVREAMIIEGVEYWLKLAAERMEANSSRLWGEEE